MGTLSNPNLPVTEERLQEFYNKIKPYMGGGGSGSDIQVEALPTASEDLEGTILQYIGVTTLTHTHGYFYECVSDGESTPTYSWQATDVQKDSAGHVIEDSEGTALTQRDTLQFGEGFSVEDDDANEKTVISPNVMQSGDMDDVVTPLPSVQSRYHRYSTEEQIVGTWIDGSTLYEKVVECGALPASGTKNVAHGITNLAYVTKMEGTAVRTSGTFAVHSMNMNDNSMRINTKIVGENVVIQTGGDFTSFTGNVTIQYTKA